MSKLEAERSLENLSTEIGGFNYAILRYFNVAGANNKANLGPQNDKASHLIKNAALAGAGKLSKIEIFGDDYETKDGSCERDFIHVVDLALAHLSALKYLNDENKNVTLNCGYGEGYSVKEIVSIIKKLSQYPFNIEIAPRRNGDIPRVVANSDKIKTLTNWIPAHNDIELICKSALDWEINRP